MSTMASVAFDVLANVLAAAVLGTAAMLRARVPDVSGVWTLTQYGQGPERERPRAEVSGGLYGSVFHRKRFRLLFRESARRQGSIATHGMDRRESDDHWRGSYILSAGGRSGDSEWRRGQGVHDFAVASDANPSTDQVDARARSLAACAQRAATRGAVMHTA